MAKQGGADVFIGFGATGGFGQPAQQPQAGGLFGNAAQTTNTGFGTF